MQPRLKSGRLGTLLAAALAITPWVLLAAGCAHEETGPLIPRIEQMSPADRASTERCTFALQTALPSAPETLRVYSVRTGMAKKPILLKLIEALPIESTPEVEELLQAIEDAPEPVGERLSLSVGGWQVEVLRGGAWVCRRDDRADGYADMVAGRKIEPPSATSVRKVADSFLARTGLMPEGAQFLSVRATRRINSTAVAWSASYGGDLDGLPVQAGVSVRVGPDLELLSARNSFREVIPDRMVPILSAQEAFDLLGTGEGYFEATTVEPGKRDVASARLTYWQGALGVDFDYLVPVYVFEFDGAAPSEPEAAFVEAIRPEYLEKRRAGQQ